MTHRRKSPVEPESIEPHMCSIDLRLGILQHVPFFAMLTVTVLLVGVLLREVHMASGMLIHELSVLLVILNGMRLLRA